MSGSHVLAVDAGTGSCRSIVFDAGGRSVASAGREWSHPPEPGVPGSHRFDTAASWRSIADSIRRSLDCAGVPPQGVAAVSATSMREGMVLYDARGTELWACPNIDGRAGAEAAELIADGRAERFYATGGDWVSITAPPRMVWLARHEPDLFRRARGLGMLSDWILYRLSDRQVTEPSAGSSSALFDLAARRWSEELVDLCGLGRIELPDVVESGTVIGAVSRRAAAETGLAAGTPVVAGGADTQLALLGAGCLQPGQAAVVGGTFWQHTTVSDRPLVDPGGRLRTLCHARPGQWMIEGIGFLSGLALRWFRDAFCQPELAEAARRGVDAYALMETLAATAPPGANGVIGVFSNVMNARRWVHAAPALVGFDITTPERSGRPECIRAIEESAAYVARANLGVCAEIAGTAPTEAIFTGGASAGRLWRQILADVLELPLHVPLVREATSLGAALLAGTAVGMHADLEAAVAGAVRYEDPVVPDPERSGIYRAAYDRWREVYGASLDMSERGMTRPLWRAAGS